MADEFVADKLGRALGGDFLLSTRRLHMGLQQVSFTYMNNHSQLDGGFDGDQGHVLSPVGQEAKVCTGCSYKFPASLTPEAINFVEGVTI